MVVLSSQAQDQTAPSDPAVNQLPLRTLIIGGGGIYAAQGLIGGLTFQGLPAVLRANEVPLDQIGLVFLAMIPWSIKFLWAPYVERFRITKDNQRRSKPIILMGEFLSAILLLTLAVTGVEAFGGLLVALGLLALVAATVDIACDGFMIEHLRPETRGWGNTAQIGGSYTGFLIGGGVFLWINAVYGWAMGAVAMAAILIVLTIPFYLLQEPSQERVMTKHRPSLGFALWRRDVWLGIAIMTIYDVGIRVTSALAGPFMVDQGIDLVTIGWVSGVGGTLAGLGGTIAGGFLVRRTGASNAVIMAIGLQILLLCLFFVLSIQSNGATQPIMGAALAQSFIMGTGFVSIYAYLMGLVSLKQAGVDFTLFQCTDAAIAALVGFGAGTLAAHVGYPMTFGAAAGYAAIALLVVVYLTKSSVAPKKTAFNLS